MLTKQIIQAYFDTSFCLRLCKSGRFMESPRWVLVVQKRAGGSIDAVSRHGRFCNRRRTHVGGSYALIAAISGLVPMMFMTRVIL